VVQTTDPLGRIQTSTPDGLDRPSTTTDFTGVVRNYTYSVLSQLTSTTSAPGTPAAGTTTTHFDALGRAFKTTSATGGITNYGFDLANNMTSLTDPANNTTSWQFDGLDRVTTETTPTGTLTYTYDQNNNLLQEVDADGRIRQFQYDHQNQQIAENWQLAGVTTLVPGSGGHSNTVQSIVVEHGATGGTWTLGYAGQTTSPIAFNAAAGIVQNALAALSTIQSGNVTVSGSGSAANPFLVAFTGSLSGTVAPLLSVNWSGIVGGSGYDQTGVGVAMAASPVAGTDQVQVVGYAAVNGAAVTSGGFNLGFGGQLTYSIPYNASASTVQAALQALQAIGAGNVLVSVPTGSAVGGTGAGYYVVTFVGALAARPEPAISIQTQQPNPLLDAGGQPVALESWIDVAGAAEQDDVQQLIVTAAAGTPYTLSYQGNATAPISAGASFSALAAAVSALPGIGQVTVTGLGTVASPYLITFLGNNRGQFVAPLALNAAMTTESIVTTYDAAGQVKSVSDSAAHYVYTYNGQGQVASVDNAGTPNVPHVLLSSQYDVLGNRTQLSATLADVPDFLNTTSYDALSRPILVKQQGQTGGDVVAPKGVALTYNAIDELTSIDRFTNLSGGPNPATDPADTALGYNTLGLLNSINHTHNGANLDAFTYSYDVLARVATFGTTSGGTATYQYDATSQLLSATYTGGTHTPPNEAYQYDLNGNRIGPSPAGPNYTGGAGNLLKSDGTFNLFNDAEGNLIEKTRMSTALVSDYDTKQAWDFRNRLTDVWQYNNAGLLTKHEHLVYDPFDRLIGREIDDTGNGSFDHVEWYVYDGSDIVLQFNAAGSLTNRYLNGPSASGADQVYAEEDVSSLTSAGPVTWPLTDALGSVRDVSDLNGTILDHLVYSAFGSVTFESTTSVHHLAGYAGGLLDPVTGDVHFGARNLNAVDAVFTSEDPLGFGAGDANQSRYVGNDPMDFVDSDGLAKEHTSGARPSTTGKHEKAEATRQAQEAAAEARREEIAAASRAAKAEAEAGAKPLECVESELIRACLNGHVQAVAILLEYGANLDVRDRDGRCPLQVAASAGYVDAVEFLVECGADVGARDVRGNTPLHRAAAEDRGDVVWALLERGADPNLTNYEGETPLFLARWCETDEVADLLLDAGARHELRNASGETALHGIASQGKSRSVVRLLEAGAEADPCEEGGVTPLWWAAMFGHIDVARVFLEHGADVDARNPPGLSVLQNACRYDANLVQLILAHGADVSSQDAMGSTALHSAAYYGRHEVVRLLLSHGANPAVKDSAGKTAGDVAEAKGFHDVAAMLGYAHLATDNPAIQSSGVEPPRDAGDLEPQETLKQERESAHDADLERGERDSQTPRDQPFHGATTSRPAPIDDPLIRLFGAVAAGSLHRVRDLLTRHPELVRATSTKGMSPAHFAACFGRTQVLRELLERGADVHARNWRGEDPLLRASQRGHVGAIALLLEHGADPLSTDKDGDSCLHHAAWPGKARAAEYLVRSGADVSARDPRGKTPLHIAVASADGDVVRALLAGGADANAPSNDGYMPLAEVRWKASHDILRQLLAAGANVNQRDARGETPLHYLAYSGDPVVVAEILDRGAEVDARDDDGATPLWNAAVRGLASVVDVLIQRGADVLAATSRGMTVLHAAARHEPAIADVLLARGSHPDARDASGETAMHVAAFHGRADVVKLLLSRGADATIQDNDGQTPAEIAALRGFACIVTLLQPKTGADVAG